MNALRPNLLTRAITRRVVLLTLLVFSVIACGKAEEARNDDSKAESGVDSEGLETLRDLIFGNAFEAAQLFLNGSPRKPTWDYERGRFYRELAEYYSTLHRFGINVETAGYRSSTLSSSKVSQFFRALCAYQRGQFGETTQILERISGEELPAGFHAVAAAFLSATSNNNRQLKDPSAQLLLSWLKDDAGKALPDPAHTDSNVSLADRWAPVLRAGVLARQALFEKTHDLVAQLDLNEPVFEETIRVTGPEGEVKELPVKYYTSFPWLVLSDIYYALSENAFTRVITNTDDGFKQAMSFYDRGIVRIALGRYPDAASDFVRFRDQTGDGSALRDDFEIAFVRPLSRSLLTECLDRSGKLLPPEDTPGERSEVAGLALEAERSRFTVYGAVREEERVRYSEMADALAKKQFHLLDDDDQRYYAGAVDRLGDFLLSSPDSLFARTLEPILHSVYRQTTNYSPTQNSLPFLLRLSHAYFVRGKVTQGQQVLSSMDANDPERQPSGYSRFYSMLTLYQQASNSIIASRSNSRSGGTRD